jgi:hypothetical protein
MAAAASDEEGHSTGIAEQTAPSEMAPGGIGFKARLAEIDDRIRRNADVLSLIVDDSRGFFGEAGGVESEAERDSSGSGSDGANASASEKGKRAHDGQEQSAGRQGAAQHQHGTDPRRRRRVADQDLDKIRSTIKQLVRDWSDEVRVRCWRSRAAADRRRRRAMPSGKRRMGQCSTHWTRASAPLRQQTGETHSCAAVQRSS